MNQPFLSTPNRREQDWTYVSLVVMDGERRLKPTHVAFDRLHFAEPPRLTSPRVEIILINGNAQQRQVVAVLPHDADAKRIPIQLVPIDQPESSPGR